MMEAIRSSETSVRKAIWSNIPEDGILQIHRRENLKSYLIPNVLFLLLDILFARDVFVT
jgi:hypothetical protein